jgi:ankyrin repeat protein
LTLQILKESPEFFQQQLDEKVEELAKVDLNSLGSNGKNCLHTACKIGDFEAVDFLLHRKVDPNYLSDERWTPLQIVASLGFIRIADLLLKDKRTRINFFDE